VNPYRKVVLNVPRSVLITGSVVVSSMPTLTTELASRTAVSVEGTLPVMIDSVPSWVSNVAGLFALVMGVWLALAVARHV